MVNANWWLALVHCSNSKSRNNTFVGTDGWTDGRTSAINTYLALEAGQQQDFTENVPLKNQNTLMKRH